MYRLTNKFSTKYVKCDYWNIGFNTKLIDIFIYSY